MPINNTDLNNVLIVAKDAVVDIPEGWKESKPSFIFIPNDGSGAQVHEFKHRPVDVYIQKELPDELTHHVIETFINALPRPLMPLISMLQLTEFEEKTNEWTLIVILSKSTADYGLWVTIPKIETEIPPESIEILREFILKITREVGPLKPDVTEEECSMTLVYREAPLMAKWYRPNFNVL